MAQSEEGHETARRIIGNSEYDVVIGRLIERTEQIQKQGEAMQRALGTFGEISARLDGTLIRLQTVLENLIKENEDNRKYDGARVARLEARISKLETYMPELAFLKEVRSRFNKTLAFIMVAAIIVLLASAKVGSVIHL